MRFRRLLKILLSLFSLSLSAIYIFVPIQILKKTSSFQLTQSKTDFLLVIFAMIVLSCIILYLVVRRIISLTFGVGVLSFGVMFGVLYFIGWGRFLLSNLFYVISGFVFGANQFLTIIFLSAIFMVFLLLVYKREGSAGIFMAQMVTLFSYMIAGYKYNIYERVDKKNIAQYGAVQLLTTDVSPDGDLISLGSQRDIRYITFSKEGVLYGCGGNQSYNNYKKNVFKFRPGDNNSLKTFDAIEVKHLYIDEKMGALFASDFQAHRLYKLDMSELTLIESTQLNGLSPQVVSTEESEYLYLIYDQPLIVEQRRKGDLTLVRRLDVLKSGICDFGSIGISITFANMNNLIAAFINCKRGFIEIDSETLVPTRLLLPEDLIPWYISSSRDKRYLYVAYPAKDFIAEIDSTTLNTTRHIHAGYGIRYVLESYDSTRLLAADYFNGIIYIIDKASGFTIAKYKFGRKTYAIAEHPVDKKLYVAGPLGVWEVGKTR